MEKIGIVADHAGFELKSYLITKLKENGFDVIDFGTNSTDSVDYPDYGHQMAFAIDKGELERGISICGSGNGISMVMNRHLGVRAALCWDKQLALLARTHNNANVCSLPARFVTFEQANEIVSVFLKTQFEGGRHIIRVEKVNTGLNG